MEEFRLIELHRTRSFGEKINATFEFVKQNFKPLGKSILLIAGPAVLIGSLMIGSFVGDFFSVLLSNTDGTGNTEAFEKYFVSVSFWTQLVLMFLFLVLSMVMSISTVNNYLFLYSQNKTNQISVQEVWDKVRSSFGMYIGSSFVLFMIFIVFYILIIVMTVMFGIASPFLSFFVVVLGLCAMAYLLIGMSLTLPIQTFEDKNIIAAIMRSMKLVQGKWWSTFGLTFVLSLIVQCVSYLFIIPYYLTLVVSMMHKVSTPAVADAGPSKFMTIGFFTLYYTVYLLLTSLPHIGIAFQYFNLVERKEAKGLMDEIENVGTTEETKRPEESY